MNDKALAISLNELYESTADMLDVVVKSQNAALERRVAAVLCIVARSSLSTGGAVLELMADLSDSAGCTDAGDPIQTPLGECIVRWAKEPPGLLNMKRVSVGDLMAIRLTMFSGDAEAVVDEELSRRVRIMTGQGAYWWIEWIRENRAW